MEEKNYNQRELPNANVILILGISSIIGCCLSYGFIGLLCSIIALVMARSANELYVRNPDLYTEVSYKNLTNGKICAQISLILSILLILIFFFLLFFIGSAAILGFFNL